MIINNRLLASCALLLASQAWAGGAPSVAVAKESIAVRDAWIRAVPPVSRNSAGYLVIENRGDRDDALVGARVDGVRVTELHEMVHEGGTMAMRRHDQVRVPAHGEAVFAPGSLHLMLIDLQRPLHPGEHREAVLRFRDAGEKKVVLEVRAP